MGSLLAMVSVAVRVPVAVGTKVTTKVVLPLGLIVLRMLTNLKVIYLREQDFRRAVRVIERLRQLDPHDPLQRRDLGVSLLHSGQPGKAIDHLQAFLATVPKGQDADTVRQMLQRARGQLARWN